MQEKTAQNDEAIKHLHKAISEPRMTKYMRESDQNSERAIELYKWNIKLSQSLYSGL